MLKMMIKKTPPVSLDGRGFFLSIIVFYTYICIKLLTMYDFTETPEDKINTYKKYENMIYKPIAIDNIVDNNVIKTLNSNLGQMLSTDFNKDYKNDLITNQPISEETVAKTTKDEKFKFEVLPGKTIDKLKAYTKEITPDADGYSFEDLRNHIKMKESNNNYRAFNKYTGKNGTVGSGAWGAYQFIWGEHKDKIKQKLGIDKPSEFLNNDKIQDDYFRIWYYDVLVPAASDFMKRNPNSKLNFGQIVEGMHFAGVAGFNKKYREGKMDQKLGSNNPSINERIKK
jgi:hypothetical protein